VEKSDPDCGSHNCQLKAIVATRQSDHLQTVEIRFYAHLQMGILIIFAHL